MEENLSGLELINVDEPFIMQQIANNILTQSYDGEIPESLLYRLLRVTELAIKNELDRNTVIEQKVIGLKIGYQALRAGSKDLGKIYAVGWGNFPEAPVVPNDSLEELSEEEKETTEFDLAVELEETSLSFEFLDNLRVRLKEAMQMSISPNEMTQYTIHPIIKVDIISSTRLEQGDSENLFGQNLFAEDLNATPIWPIGRIFQSTACCIKRNGSLGHFFCNAQGCTPCRGKC